MSNEENGQQFYSALQAKSMDALKDVLKSNIYSINPTQGDFMWRYENGDHKFNQGTFNYISANILPDSIPGVAHLSSEGGFPNAYNQIVNSIVYTLSKENQDKLYRMQNDASMEAQTIVGDYENIFKPITDAQLAEAHVETGIDYVISYVLGSLWSGKKEAPLTYTEMAGARNLTELLPKMPLAGDQIVTDVSTYLAIMQPVNGLKDSLQNGAYRIKKLKENSARPSDKNGGIKLFDPSNGTVLDGYQVGYSINTPFQAINNDLQNKERSISLTMTTAQSSGSSLSVNINGQAGFDVGSWLKFSTEASGEYDMSKAQGTSTECSVTMKWEGYSLVSMSPTAWQQATNVGWYDKDVIEQAVENGDKDVDGFKFVSAAPYNMEDFIDGGNFGRLTNLLIANYPTIEITYKHADYSKFQQSWNEKISGNLTLFGFIKLGSINQGAYGSTFQEGADNSTFTVKFSASPQVTSVPQYQMAAFVIGGAIENPGV